MTTAANLLVIAAGLANAKPQFSKTDMYRNQKLLRAVASLPCQHCGLDGQTQAAHANWSWSGKGMGIKAHDVFVCALCQSCHYMIDQGKDLQRWEREEIWMKAWRQTMFELFTRGLVDVRT